MPCNQASLRADLNSQGLEQGLFLFAPHGPHVVTVFLGRMGHDLAYMYHLKQVRMPMRVIRGYLFLRFAWNFFKSQGPDLASIADDMADPPDVGGKRKGRASPQGRILKKAKTSAGNEEDVGVSSGGGGGEIGDSDDSDDESGPLTEDDEATFAVYGGEKNASL